MASSVVGTPSQLTPRRYVDAAKPVMSVMTPPPRPTKTLRRSAPAVSAARQICSTLPTCFSRSPAAKITSATARPVAPSALRVARPCNGSTFRSLTSRSDDAPPPSSPRRGKSPRPTSTTYDCSPAATAIASRRHSTSVASATCSGVRPSVLTTACAST